MKDVLVYNANGERLIRLAQWDRDVHICITDADISQAYPVHFFNKNSDQAYVVASTYADGTLKANIPDLLLREPYTICGYIQRNDGDVERRSDFRFVVSVVPKPQPSDYIARNSPDYLELEDLIANYEELIEQAEQAIKNAEDANNKATSIVNDAQTAIKNANAATAAANTATQNAKEATKNANKATSEAEEATEAALQAVEDAQAVINQAIDLAFIIDEGDGGLDVTILKEGY